MNPDEGALCLLSPPINECVSRLSFKSRKLSNMVVSVDLVSPCSHCLGNFQPSLSCPLLHVSKERWKPFRYGLIPG